MSDSSGGNNNKQEKKNPSEIIQTATAPTHQIHYFKLILFNNVNVRLLYNQIEDVKNVMLPDKTTNVTVSHKSGMAHQIRLSTIAFLWFDLR
jgi:ABC-type uncharacterized transport system substrate-binding protein